jgi:N-acylneuraminate cytidylyltransferase
MSRCIVAFIPARGGSKGIPLKNIKRFCGRPLVYWVISAAHKCDYIDKVYVSTDSDLIAKEVSSFSFQRVEIIERSAGTADDLSSTESAMIEFAEKKDFTDIVLIQATSPLLDSLDLSRGIEKYLDSGSDSLLSVVRQKRFIWKESGQPLNYDPLARPRRQEWEGFLVENGAFYITSRAKLLQSGCRISGAVSFYEMTEDSYFEIDDEHDWIIAEHLKYRQLKTNPPELPDLKRIKLLVCDVDGVLTDGGMYYTSNGQEMKKFNTRDGMGIELVRNAGIKIMMLTSEQTDIITNRGKKLKVDYLFMGIKDKVAHLSNFFMENSEYSFDTTAYIGDDVNDLPAMSKVLFSAAPSDACDEVKRKSHFICHAAGGGGCVREICDLIIRELKNA